MMLNEEIIREMVVHEVIFEDNIDDDGRPYWTADDFRDADNCADIVKGFSISGMTIEENDILYWEMISVIESMDLDKLANHLQNQIDIYSYDPWTEHRADWYGF